MSSFNDNVKIRPFHFWSQKVLPLVYELAEYIREQLDNLFIDSLYEADTETLVLVIGRESDNA